MTDMMAMSAQPIEQQNIDIALCDGQYVFKFDSTNINDKKFDTLRRAVFNALKPKPKRIQKKIAIANLTPEQIELRRASRRKWYNANAEQAKDYIKNKYHTDYDYWKKTTDHVREKHRLERLNVEPKKRGRKPTRNLTPSPIASDDDEVLINKLSQDKTKKNREPKPKQRIGRPYKVKFEQLFNQKTDDDNTVKT
jgi:hypothetical protein